MEQQTGSADDLNLTGETCPQNCPAFLRDYPTRPGRADLAIERSDTVKRDHFVIRFVARGDDLVVLRMVESSEPEFRHAIHSRRRARSHRIAQRRCLPD